MAKEEITKRIGEYWLLIGIIFIIIGMNQTETIGLPIDIFLKYKNFPTKESMISSLSLLKLGLKLAIIHSLTESMETNRQFKAIREHAQEN